MDDATELYCLRDDFCKDCEPMLRRRQLQAGKRVRRRIACLSLAELMTLLVGGLDIHSEDTRKAAFLARMAKLVAVALSSQPCKIHSPKSTLVHVSVDTKWDTSVRCLPRNCGHADIARSERATYTIRAGQAQKITSRPRRAIARSNHRLL